jgi:hypothetical protein
MVWFTTQQVFCAALDFVTIQVPHGLPFAPLPTGVWWTSDSPNTYFDIAIELPAYSGGMPLIEAIVETDETNVYFNVYNNLESLTDITFYFKLAFFMPNTYTGVVQDTIAPAGSFLLNTSDYNYLKILSEGRVLGGSNPTVIPHNLGYIPQCRLWNRDNRSTGQPNRWRISTGYNDAGSNQRYSGKIDSNALTLYGVSESNNTIDYYYHIYGDQI